MNMQAQTVTKNTSYLTMSYIWQKILSFFYFVMVARFIGVESLGKYTFAIAFATLLAVFVDMGLTQALIRESAKYRDKSKKYLSVVLTMKLLFSLIVYSLIVLMVNLMNYPEITRHLVYIAGLTMVFDQLTLTFWGVFRGLQNLKLESVNVVINQIIIVIVGLTVLYLKLPLIYLMLPFVCASLFSLLFSYFSVKKVLNFRLKFTVNKDLLKVLFLIAIPFALISIFSRIYGYIDSVMLSKLVGDKAVGWYSVAMKIPFALQFIPAALAAAIFPAFSQQFLHDKSQLKYTFDRVMKFLCVIVLPISAGIAVLAQPIIEFFYGSEYLPAVLPLQIMMFGLFFVFLNYPLGSLLNACNKQVTNTVLVGLIMVLNVSINIILIPKYSFVGASIAFLISHGLLFTISLFVAKKIIPYSKVKLLFSFLKSGFSAGVMGFVIYSLIGYFHFIILIIFGVVIYFGCQLIIKGITKEDLKYFLNIISKKNINAQ